MAEVIAKMRTDSKEFEILVDLDKALEFKSGKGDIRDVLSIDNVYTDSKKGQLADEESMKKVFGSTDVYEVASEIIKRGTVQLTAEYRKKLRQAKVKQIVDFLHRNCVDPKTGLPHPPARIENALEEAGVKIDEFRKVEQQIDGVLKELKKILPIRVETKQLAVKIPAVYTGKAYGFVKEYAKKEEWLSDGSLVCEIELPAGAQEEFFDKLNSMTHGSAETKELK